MHQIKKAIITKQKQIINQKFSRARNAVLDSDSTTKQELQNLPDLIHDKKNHWKNFSESGSALASSIKGKRRKKITSSQTSTTL